MFPAQVNVQQAPAVAGMFASSNPRSSVLAGQGALTAGATGVTVGNFAWVTNGVAESTGTGLVTGFCARELQAVITTWLAEASLSIPQGVPVTLYNAGDFWVKNTGAGAVTVGMTAYANTADGSVQFAASGSTIAGAIATKFTAMSPAAAGELVMISSTQIG